MMIVFVEMRAGYSWAYENTISDDDYGDIRHIQAEDYALGDIPPRYPVPSCIGPTTFGRLSILTWQADKRADRPAAEYWNERKTKPAPTGWR